MSAYPISKKGDEALIINDEEVRIVMIGKTGAGKSATGNTILGYEAFKSTFSFRSCTSSCDKAEAVVGGRKVSVIDTPGLFDTKFSKDETGEEIRQCISFAAPGPQVFLVVIKLGRFTEEEQKSVEMIQKLFGEMSTKYTIVLFTNGDQVEQPIETLLNDCPELQELINKCDGRYHVFNNKNQNKDPSQVTELLVKIKSMVQMNGGSHYTTEMFQQAERAIEEETQRILRAKEENRRKKEEDLKKKYDREALEKVNKLIKEQQEQQARLAKEMEKRERKAQENEKKMKEEHERQRKEQQERSEKEKEEAVRMEREECERRKEEELKEARRQAERKNKFIKSGQWIGAAAGVGGGGWAGVQTGTAIGAWFGPIGAGVGAAVGGVVGGIAGGIGGFVGGGAVGEELAE